MPAKYRSPIYNVKAILKPITITTFGKKYAIEDGADGYPIVDIQPQQAPTDIKTYIEGNNTITSYPVATNITKIYDYAFNSFPNLESIYLFKNDGLVELSEHSFDNLVNLESVYVPDVLYDLYVDTYPDFTDLFKEYTTTMDLVIPVFSGITKLTKEIVRNAIGLLSEQKQAVIERIVVPSDYIELDDEVFSDTHELTGCKTLVLENIFTGGTDIFKGNSLIKYVYVDNDDIELNGVCDSTNVADFKWLVPYQNIPLFIAKEYIKDYYVTGYVMRSQGQSMPSRIESGYWKWYSSIDTTEDSYLGDTETYTEATYTGTYFAFIMIDTVIVSGSGELTNAIIQNAIDSIDTELSPLSQIVKISIENTFSGESVSNVILNMLNSLNAQLPNLNNSVYYGGTHLGILMSATVTGLGNEDISTVSFTKNSLYKEVFDEVTDSNNNIFVKFPTMYRKVNTITDNQITSFTVSRIKVDNTYIPYPCFLKPNGDIMPYILIGKYCFSSTTVANSVNANAVGLKSSNARTLARALGSGYQLYDWQMRQLFVDLAIIRNRTVNVAANEILQVARQGGICVDGVIRINDALYICYDPNNYIDSDVQNYTVLSYYTVAETDYIKKLGYDANNPFALFPTELGGTASTYYADRSTLANYKIGNYPYWSNPSATDGIFHFGGALWSNPPLQRLCYRPVNE